MKSLCQWIFEVKKVENFTKSWMNNNLEFIDILLSGLRCVENSRKLMDKEIKIRKLEPKSIRKNWIPSYLIVFWTEKIKE